VSEEASRVFRVRRTVLQMLRDRGYIISPAEENLDVQGFVQRYGDPPRRDQLMLMAPHTTDPTNMIIVFFAQEVKVGVKTLKEYFDCMEREKIRHGILVVQNKLTPFAKQTLLDLASSFVLEEFKEGELLVNITQHVLVPQHTVLSSQEKAALLKRYKLKDEQLPRMLKTDPIARYYGLVKGQVVKITRPSETAGRYVTYRLVV